MAEYQGYIAPLAQSQSYSDALQARMDVIRQQQMQNMQLLLDAKNKQDAITTQQLEKLYSLRTNGWGEEPIKAFAEQRDTFAQKLKSNQYTDQASFLADLSKLADTHAMFSSHYETTNPIIRQTQQYMAQPGVYPDRNMKVTENVDTLNQKIELQRNLGIKTFNIAGDGSIQYFGADGNPLDLSVAMNPAAYLPKVEPAFISPTVLANEYIKLYQVTLNEGKTGSEFVASILPSAIAEVKADPARLLSAKTHYQNIMGSSVIDESKRKAGETDEDYYVRYYVESALNTFTNTNLPKEDKFEYFDAVKLGQDYSRSYEAIIDKGKSGDDFVRETLQEVVIRVLSDPTLLTSAKIHYETVNGTSEGVDPKVYATSFAESALKLYANTRSQTPRTGGGGRSAVPAAPKPPAIMSVTANKVQTEGFSLKDPINGQTLIPGAKPQSYYEYSFPDAIAKVNLSPFVDGETRAQLEGKLDYEIQSLRFNQNGDIILSGVFIGGTGVGDVTIKRETTVYNQIGATLKKEYGYDITKWANGTVHDTIQGQSSGVPQATQPGTGTVIKFNGK